MATLADLLIRLERRLIVVETALGITAGKEDLIHPKSQAQAQAQAVIAEEKK